MLERTHKSSIFVTDMIKMYTLGYFQCLSPCSLQAEASLLHLGYNTWLWVLWVMHSSTKGLYFDPSSSSARFCIWHIDNIPPSSKVQGHSYSQRWVSKDKSFSVLWELVCSPSASNSVAKESRLVKFFPQQKTYWLVRKKRSAGWSPFFLGEKVQSSGEANVSATYRCNTLVQFIWYNTWWNTQVQYTWWNTFGAIEQMWVQGSGNIRRPALPAPHSAPARDTKI